MFTLRTDVRKRSETTHLNFHILNEVCNEKNTNWELNKVCRSRVHFANIKPPLRNWCKNRAVSLCATGRFQSPHTFPFGSVAEWRLLLACSSVLSDTLPPIAPSWHIRIHQCPFFARMKKWNISSGGKHRYHQTVAYIRRLQRERKNNPSRGRVHRGTFARA